MSRSEFAGRNHAAFMKLSKLFNVIQILCVAFLKYLTQYRKLSDQEYVLGIFCLTCWHVTVCSIQEKPSKCRRIYKILRLNWGFYLSIFKCSIHNRTTHKHYRSYIIVSRGIFCSVMVRLYIAHTTKLFLLYHKKPTKADEYKRFQKNVMWKKDHIILTGNTSSKIWFSI